MAKYTIILITGPNIVKLHRNIARCSISILTPHENRKL